MNKTIIAYLSPEQDAHLTDSVAGGVVAGRDVNLTEGGCLIGVAGRDLHLKEGRAGILKIGNGARIERSTIGLLLGKPDTKLEGNKVLLTGSQVVIFGVVTGAVFAIVNTLFRSLMKKRPLFKD